MAYVKTWVKRHQLDLCVRCGRERGSDGTSWMCRKCADYQNRVSMARKRRLIEAGLCVECMRPAQKKRQRCRRCGILNSKRTIRLYREKRKQQNG
jgi:hypothetical protein